MESIKDITNEILKCKRCKLHLTKTNYVPGDGNENARIVFVGEAPGREEDKQGKPFVGSAGKLLNETLLKFGIRRERVFITNVLKCRPPNNRDPLNEEIEACIPYLYRQIMAIKPDVIVCLGRHSSKQVLGFFGEKFRGITSDRGKFFEVMLNGKKIVIMPTYHPAAILYKPQLKDVFEDDIKKVAEIIGKLEKKRTLFDFF